MRSSRYRPRAPRRVSGFTMLEVLISIVVIAFGMLGIAGLQAFALKNSQSASLRSVATVLASDLIDRMQANPVGATDGRYDEGAATAAKVALNSTCLAAGCTDPALLAGHDLAEWKAAVTAALPNATAMVCLDAAVGAETEKAGDTSVCDRTGSQYVIYIWWRDDRTKSGTGTGRFTTPFHI